MEECGVEEDDAAETGETVAADVVVVVVDAKGLAGVHVDKDGCCCCCCCWCCCSKLLLVLLLLPQPSCRLDGVSAVTKLDVILLIGLT